MENIPKRFTDSVPVWLYLQDEAEHIGTGWRKVLSVVGRKWAYVHYPYTSTTKKFSLSQYNNILHGSQKRMNKNGSTFFT